MKKTEKNLYLLYSIFSVALVTANVIGAKLFSLGFNLFSQPVTMTVGAICYPITFLVTDILSENWGKEKATFAVRCGPIAQMVCTLILVIARFIPAVDNDVQQSFIKILGQNYLFFFGSIAAYLCSQEFDVFLFHKIRNKWLESHNSTFKGKWIWNNAATIVSQLIDTVIMASIVFGFGFGYFWSTSGRIMLLNMILGQWILKSALALLDTPFFYFFTRKEKTN